MSSLDATTDHLRRILFDGANRDSVFAVLDGCMIEQLPARLDASGCEHACLFSGPLDPMLEEAAPHLVRMRPEDPFSQLVLHQGWHEDWGIVLHTDGTTDLRSLRQHLRKYLRVLNANGEPMFFRFYDPRAFRVVVPLLDADARAGFFGPVRRYFVDSGQPDTLLRYDAGAPPAGRSIALAEAATAMT